MTTFEKVNGVGLMLGVLYMFFCVPNTEDMYKVKIKYQNNLIELPYLYTSKEIDNLYLKDRNDILFTDGMYFFEEAPKNLKHFKCKLVDHSKVEHGFGNFEKFATLFSILIIMFVICAGGGGDYYDSYD